jgi:hypothetical protein
MGLIVSPSTSNEVQASLKYRASHKADLSSPLHQGRGTSTEQLLAAGFGGLQHLPNGREPSWPFRRADDHDKHSGLLWVETC